MQTITSRKNAIIKDVLDICSHASMRRDLGLFFCEGARLCEDAARTGIIIEKAFFTSKAMKKYQSYTDRVAAKSKASYIIEDHVAEALSQTKNTQGVFCLCRIPQAQGAVYKGKILVLENTQDPANIGTIMRTAEALGIDMLILTGQCCDIYSPKSLRASMGAVFRMNVILQPDTEGLLAELKAAGCTCYASIPSEIAGKLGKFKFQTNSAVFIGNEGSGLTESVIDSCDNVITIPMLGRAESLNAAAAASILMWEMIKG